VWLNNPIQNPLITVVDNDDNDRDGEPQLGTIYNQHLSMFKSLQPNQQAVALSAYDKFVKSTPNLPALANPPVIKGKR
jgi:hypothetical protein